MDLPPVRGVLTANRPMAELTWLRVGGPADWFFQPADAEDLAAITKAVTDLKDTNTQLQTAVPASTPGV